MSEFKVSSRYAKALLDLAVEQGALEVVKQNIEQFIDVLKGHRELLAVLKNPIIKQDKKKNVLSALFADKFHATVLGFFRLMIDKGRANVLYATALEFVREYHERQGIVIAQVVSAAALSEAHQAQLKELISESTGHQVILQNKVNADLIGGFVVTVGDRQLDVSIAGRLDRLDRAFHS